MIFISNGGPQGLSPNQVTSHFTNFNKNSIDTILDINASFCVVIKLS